MGASPRPSPLPLAGAEQGKQAPQRPRWVEGGGRAGRWAARAEGSGLPEPRQHTCVSYFLPSLLSACLLPALPEPPCSGGCNQFGWKTANTLGVGGVGNSLGWESFRGFVTCQQLADPSEGVGTEALAVPGVAEVVWDLAEGRRGSASAAPAACQILTARVYVPALALAG